MPESITERLGTPQRLAPHGRLLAAHQPHVESGDDFACDFVLDGKDVLEVAVIAFRPDVVAAGRLQQLHRDPQAVPGAAHAAFQHVTDAEFAADLAHVDGLSLVGEA